MSNFWEDDAVVEQDGSFWDEDATTPDVPMLDSAMRGASQGMTLGHADELTAGIGAAWDSGQAALGLRGDIDFGDAYDSRIDLIRKKDEAAKEANPWTYGAGEFAGAVAPAVISGGASTAAQGLTKTATLAQRAKALGVAGLGGGTAGSGYSEGDFGSDQHLFDTALGAGLGVATAGAGQLLGKAAQKAKLGEKLGHRKDQIANYLHDKFAPRSYAKAALGQNKKAFKEIAARPGGIEGFGRKLGDTRVMDEDGVLKRLVGAGDTVDDIGAKAGQKLDQLSEVYDDIFKQADTMDPQAFSPMELAVKMRDYAKDKFRHPNNASVRDKILAQADEFEKMGLNQLPAGQLGPLSPKGTTLSEAQAIKNSYRWKPNKGMPTPDELQPDVQNTIKKLVGNQMDDTVGAIDQAQGPGQTGIKGVWDNLKSEYGPIRQTAELADDRAIANLSNRAASPSDHGAGLTAYLGSMATGAGQVASMGKAAVVGAINNQVRARGRSVAAVGADKLADMLKKFPQKFGPYQQMLLSSYNKGGYSLGATHHILWKNDPKYRQLFSDRTMNEDGDLPSGIDSDYNDVGH